MNRRRLIWIAVVAIGVPGCLAMAEEPPTKEVTPTANREAANSEQHKLFDAYRAAVEREDWNAAAAMLSDEAADRLCKQLLSKINDQLDRADGYRADRSFAVIRWLLRADRARIESFVDRHDLGDVNPDDLTEFKADRRKLLVDAQKSTSLQMFPEFKPGLSRLMVDRDLAWAHAAYTVARPARVTPIGFLKRNDKWLIYVPPDGWNDWKPAVPGKSEEPRFESPPWKEPEEGKAVPGFVNAEGEKDLKLMQGKWRILSLLADGEQMTEDPDEPGGWTISENRTIYRSGKYDRLTLDGSKKPGHMDVYNYDFEGELTLMHAIYEINGDTMRVCVDVEEKGRPADFTSRFNSGRRSFVLERVK